MIPFLKSVALAYTTKYAVLSDFCFVFPNKRSATFFLKHLKDEMAEETIVAPATMTIADFAEQLSGRIVAPTVDQIFYLYDCYRELLGMPAEEEETDDAAINFDSFRIWGETVLADFSTVDQYLADAEEIFKNVKDYREIASNFLTEEQKKVMKEFLGYEDAGDPEDFWKSFGEEENLSKIKNKFLHLWRILFPLYEKFNQKLEDEGLTTTGRSYRQALHKLEEKGRHILPYKKIVFVGFNALSTSEKEIFSVLKTMDGYPGFDAFADFFWDCTGPVLSNLENGPSKFIKAGIKHFPAPDWALPSLRLSDTQSMPDISVIAAPSNSAQTKIAGKLLRDFRSRETREMIAEAKVALVLPDENLLLPMLYSIPKEIKSLNLTMGYSFRQTSVVSFISLLRRLWMNMRVDPDGARFFFHKDLRLLLAHPFLQISLERKKIEKIFSYLDESHKITPSLEEISGISPEMREFLEMPLAGSAPTDTINFIDSLLKTISGHLMAENAGSETANMEVSQIETYRCFLTRLSDALSGHKIGMNPSTVFRLADRLSSGVNVTFEGEPLSGLQVMGSLETRSLDFENIFILSMNERIMPRRARKRSFIPDTLRKAYGIPPSNYAEEIFAYYFYRMICRAKKVTLIYDSSGGSGGNSGGVSRYILQLRHLFGEKAIKETHCHFELYSPESSDVSVEKSPFIRERLIPFLNDSGERKNFSASSLDTYRKCQVEFFYRYVMGINTDDLSSESMDSITIGNILHETMMELYLPVEELRGKLLDNPVTIDKDYLESILNDEEKIEKLIARKINVHHYHLNPEESDRPLGPSTGMIARQLKGLVMKMIRHDLTLTPFRLFGCEISETLRIMVKDGRKVNFRFAIDRLDEINEEGKPRLRIVDYKTGKTKITASSIDDMFSGNYKASQSFQLFTYAWLLNMKNVAGAEDVRTEIYYVPELLKNSESLPQIGKDTVKSYSKVKEEFEEGMKNMVNGIFDSEVFRQTDNDSSCRICAFRRVCGK